MPTKQSLESLAACFEQLVLQKPELNVISQVHRKRITDKFANKSLNELNEIVGQLKVKVKSCKD